MANTSLVVPVPANGGDHNGDHDIIHAELNELSRSTGLRNVTSVLANGWTVASNGGVRLERVRDIVHLYWRGLNGSAATSNAFLLLGVPSSTVISGAFAPMGGSYQSEVHWDDSGDGYRIRAITANIQVATTSERRELGGYWRHTSWRTLASWPLELPGVPVS